MRRLTSTILAFAAIALSAFALAAPRLGTSAAMPHDDPGFLYVEAPKTLAELYASADLVALVQVDRTLPSRVVGASVRIPGALFTDSTAEILRTYKGTAASSITLFQTGGSVGAFHEGNPHDPLFVRGTQSVLFLRTVADGVQASSGQVKYRAISPTGRLDIGSDDRISIHYGESPLIGDLNGKPLASLERALEALKTP